MAQGDNQRTAEEMSDDERASFTQHGRMGGLQTAKRGSEYYSEIGRKGRAVQLERQRSGGDAGASKPSKKTRSRLRRIAEAVQIQDENDPISQVF